MKKYQTRDGREVVIHTTKGMDKDFPIIGEIKWVGGWYVKGWTKDGLENPTGEKSNSDLVEVSPYSDWPIDSKVLCWTGNKNTLKSRQHFAGVDKESGKPMTWSNYKTSWSASDNHLWVWDYMELAE